MSYTKNHVKYPILKENRKEKNQLRKRLGMKWDEYHELEILLVKANKTLSTKNGIRKKLNMTWIEFEQVELNLIETHPPFSQCLSTP